MKLLLGLILVAMIGSAFGKTNCVAHRGNNRYFLENSFSSLRSAYTVGAHAVEYDVRHTFDEIPIIIHDSTLKRVAMNKPGRSCPLGKKVKDLIFHQIRENCMLKNGEEIPLLTEVLSLFSTKNIIQVIEFKDIPNFFTLNYIALLSLHKPSKIKIISFKEKALDFVDIMRNSLNFFKNVDLLHLRVFYGRPKNGYGQNVRYSKRRLKRVKKLTSVPTGVWTVDDPEKMLRVIKSGVTYLTTNDPQTCLELI